ncbi:hypothetical protein TUM12151_07460 [Morganella morganii]|nr:hypothetical protein TUM12149_12570 [Morganella morganii]GIZ33760.1 hypothetical protein TUM12151_07460 [Morganella morganii]
MEVTAGQAPVDHFNRTDLNNIVPLVVGTQFVHTGGFGIENNLSCNISAHNGVLCQTQVIANQSEEESTRDE